jgi:simple sugar transport system permease protein
MMETLASLLSGSVSFATPLLLAALGEIIIEKSGLINISLEGMMLVAAFFAMYVSLITGSPLLGLVAAILATLLFAGLFAVLCVGMQADQIIAGAGLNIFALGLTGVLLRGIFGVTGAAITAPTFAILPLPLLSHLPIVGRALFTQNFLVYLALLLIPITWLLLTRTRFGMNLRAVGENPAAVDAAGLPVKRLRFFAVMIGGGYCGLAGAYLSIAQANTFIEGMTAGRGFIALAIVVFAGWRPFSSALVALLFGVASSLQFQFQALGLKVPYQFFLMLQYILTIVLAAFFRHRIKAPAAMAKSYFREG